MAGINDDIAALDFDLACSTRLQIYDVEVMKTNAKLIAYEVSKLFGGQEEDTEDW